jgi:hypothetical protein
MLFNPLRLTDSDYPFGIFKLFLYYTQFEKKMKRAEYIPLPVYKNSRTLANVFALMPALISTVVTTLLSFSVW